METTSNPSGASAEAAELEQLRADQQKPKRTRRMPIVDVCLCGEVLPHVTFCPFTNDPEICS